MARSKWAAPPPPRPRRFAPVAAGARRQLRRVGATPQRLAQARRHRAGRQRSARDQGGARSLTLQSDARLEFKRIDRRLFVRQRREGGVLDRGVTIAARLRFSGTQARHGGRTGDPPARLRRGGRLRAARLPGFGFAHRAGRRLASSARRGFGLRLRLRFAGGHPDGLSRGFRHAALGRGLGGGAGAFRRSRAARRTCFGFGRGRFAGRTGLRGFPLHLAASRRRFRGGGFSRGFHSPSVRCGAKRFTAIARRSNAAPPAYGALRSDRAAR